MRLEGTHGRMYCDKCGKEIEHNLFHTIEWFDSYEQDKTTVHKACEICNKCHAAAFHAFLQCGKDVEEVMKEATPSKFTELKEKILKKIEE